MLRNLNSESGQDPCSAGRRQIGRGNHRDYSLQLAIAPATLIARQSDLVGLYLRIDYVSWYWNFGNRRGDMGLTRTRISRFKYFNGLSALGFKWLY